jgi:hypothetical protein
MNRYEQLFGSTYRDLVAQLRKTLQASLSPTHEDINVSVLSFRSFTESFYYVDTLFNPLVPPEDYKLYIDPLVRVDYCGVSAKVLWCLGAYFCSAVGLAQLKRVFNDSDELAEANGSTFELTYKNFSALKAGWLNWANTNGNSFSRPDLNEITPLHPLVCQTFLLANLLITMLPVSVKATNSASDIYKRIMTAKSPASTWIDNGTARLVVRPNQRYRWRYIKNPKSFGQLLDIVEFTLLQPLSMGTKEDLLEKIYFNYLVRGRAVPHVSLQEFDMTALACPLFYQGQFQGIVYAAKEFKNTGFTNTQAERFYEIIASLHVKSRISESRFDLARMAILRENAEDSGAPSETRILNTMHFFSSASGGFAVCSDGESVSAYERYRQPVPPSRLQMKTARRDDAREILGVIESIVPTDALNRKARWYFDSSEEFKRLTSLPSNGEKSARSAAILPMTSEGAKRSYIVFFFREDYELVERNRFEPHLFDSSALWDSYASRLQNSLHSLMDVDNEHKKLAREHEIVIDLERARAQDKSQKFIHGFSLFMPHEAMNRFKPRFITPLLALKDELPDDEMKKRLDPVIRYAERFTKQNSKLTTAFRKQLEQQEQIALNASQFDGLYESLKEGVRNEFSDGIEMDWKVESGHDLTINVHIDIVGFLINQLVFNAVENSNEVAPTDRRVRVLWSNGSGSDTRSKAVSISVWNAGTSIHPDVVMNAGKTPAKNVEAGHTGLGFYFFELLLAELNAVETDDGRHFHIEHTSSPKGVEVSFAFPAT